MASSKLMFNSFWREKGPVTTFIEVSFQKILDCHSIWLTLDGEHRDVARRSLAFVCKNMKNGKADVIDLYANFSYHRASYSALTNNSNIKQAHVRCQCNPNTQLGHLCQMWPIRPREPYSKRSVCFLYFYKVVINKVVKLLK